MSWIENTNGLRRSGVEAAHWTYRSACAVMAAAPRDRMAVAKESARQFLATRYYDERRRAYFRVPPAVVRSEDVSSWAAELLKKAPMIVKFGAPCRVVTTAMTGDKNPAVLVVGLWLADDHHYFYHLYSFQKNHSRYRKNLIKSFGDIA
ncbi:hypothetical protein [Niveispirillum sp.]|uniref:hypothetical protein n=1 Tax=Niveispirillum sp. TaxID=1917217 RepID=UPI001B60D476|nr:hypothetical protein [Niveispirillum sp.]MBP7338785.1 hypothetical protein [Niveispirillum sp.]